MIYPVALGVISLGVFALERVWPRRPHQSWNRPGLLSDLLHLVFNGHFLGVILYTLGARYLSPSLDGWLASVGLEGVVYRGVAGGWPLLLQIVLALFVIDLMQWAIHRLLHAVPLFWRVHQVHHSVVDGQMDWVVAFRFSWLEVVLYKAIQYLPLAWLGFSGEAVMVHAIFGTLIGHLNHANLRWDYGPLTYLLNSPAMHLWHHDYDGPVRGRNFGIIFSCWDWIFGTAELPDQDPRELGFPGVDAVPDNFFAQEIWPLGNGWNPWLASAGGLALIGGAWLAL